jgi:ATP-dependent DNA helicase RecG
MNQTELRETIKKGESETVEFKENFDKETIETVGAFANTKGGNIFIGVSDKGKVIGVRLTKETTNSWVNQIAQSTDPRMMPEIEVDTIDGKNVVTIFVKEFPIKPISVKGRCFRRVGTSNRMMTPREITELHMYIL